MLSSNKAETFLHGITSEGLPNFRLHPPTETAPVEDYELTDETIGQIAITSSSMIANGQYPITNSRIR